MYTPTDLLNTDSEVQIEFSHPLKDAVKTNFKSMMTCVLDLSPSDAACQAVLKKTGEFYRASIVIHSQVTTFFSQCTSSSLEKVLKTVQEDLMDQILRWKRTRMLDAN